MIALFIIGGIIVILIILLNCPVTAELKYWDGTFNVKVKYLFFTIFPMKMKEKKIKKNKKKTKVKKKIKSNNKNSLSKVSENKLDIEKEQKDKVQSVQKSENENNEKPNDEKKEKLSNKKDEIFKKIEMIKTLLESSKKGMRRIVKGIFISDIKLDFVVANEEAYNAALAYGKINMITYNAISFLRVFFTISIEKIDINCKFNSAESVYNGQCKVKLRPATGLLAAISIFYHYLVNTYKKKKEKSRNISQQIIERNGN